MFRWYFLFLLSSSCISYQFCRTKFLIQSILDKKEVKKVGREQKEKLQIFQPNCASSGLDEEGRGA